MANNKTTPVTLTIEQADRTAQLLEITDQLLRTTEDSRLHHDLDVLRLSQ